VNRGEQCEKDAEKLESENLATRNEAMNSGQQGQREGVGTQVVSGWARGQPEREEMENDPKTNVGEIDVHQRMCEEVSV